METLTEKKCQACEGKEDPLNAEEIREYLNEVDDQWEVLSDHKWITRTFKFKNFQKTMDFANEITKIAESEQHHPDFYISYGQMTVYLSTHAINGLSENDFIVAAKIDELTDAW